MTDAWRGSVRLALATLLAAALVPAACSSSGPKSDARDAGRESGGDTVEQPVPDGGDDAVAPPDAAVSDTSSDDADAGEADATEVASADASDAEGGPTEAGVDGASDVHASETGDTGAPPCPTCGFYAMFTPVNESTLQVAPGYLRYQASYTIDLVNGSDQMASLANVKIRYWFSTDGSSWVWNCVGPTCALLSGGGIVGIPPRAGGTDSYVELAFSMGKLDAFSDTGPIQQILMVPIAPIFVLPTIDNDYSFQGNPALPNPHVTVYVNNKLVWGMEP
jgi:hypothetical protein